MNKNYILLLVLVLIVSIGFNISLFVGKSDVNEKDTKGPLLSYKRAKEPFNLPLAQSASCNFEKDMSVTYPENITPQEVAKYQAEADKYGATYTPPQTGYREIKFALNENSQPITISFTDLDTDKPKMRGNAGQDDLIKIVDTEDVVTLIEKSPLSMGTLQSFTVFKKTGVGIWTKQYDLIGTPFGLVSMGYCD